MFQVPYKYFILTKCFLMWHITGPNAAIYGQYYSRANYHNIRGLTKWTEEALNAIRLNMKDQHTEMKRQLQERHKDIANHVGQDVSGLIVICSSNSQQNIISFLFYSDCRCPKCIGSSYCRCTECSWSGDS